MIDSFDYMHFSLIGLMIYGSRHSRKKFGLLEKHKDYVERARVFHQKEQALQVNICLRWIEEVVNTKFGNEQFIFIWFVYEPYRNLRKRQHLGIQMSSTSR